MNNIVLSIDPGYDRCGWAIMSKQARKLTVVEKGCIHTYKTTSLLNRYKNIVEELQEIFSRTVVHEVAIETIFFSKNTTTAIQVAQVRGIVISLAIQYEAEVFEYNPMQIKQAVTGSGRADKKAVEKMVRIQLKLDPQEKIIDDTIDAIAIGITHLASRKTLR